MREIVEKYTGFSNRLGDRVKKDERNGYQMRAREEKTVGYGVFVGSSKFYFGVFSRFSFNLC